jgi:uncharacterized Tic20 family protein
MSDEGSSGFGGSGTESGSGAGGEFISTTGRESSAEVAKSQEVASQAGHAVWQDGTAADRLHAPSSLLRTPPLAPPDRGEPPMPMVAEMPPPAPRPFDHALGQGAPVSPGDSTPPGRPVFMAGAPGAAGWQGAGPGPGAGPGAAPGAGPGPGFGGPHSGPFWRGQRLVDPRVSDSDRAVVVIMHLWWIGCLFTGFVLLAFLPLILWAVRQSSSGFVDDHGREILNAQLTILLFAVSIIGLPVAIVLSVVSMVNSVRGAVAAAQREHFRYGMIFRPLG